MRFTLITAGSMGDVRPYVALAARLQALGHAARLLCSGDFEPLARSAGVPFVPLRRGFSELAHHPACVAAKAPDSTLPRRLTSLVTLARESDALLYDWLLDTLEASRDADCIVASPFALGAPHVAERLGIACAWAPLWPVCRTEDFPFFAWPQHKRPLGPVGSRLTYDVLWRGGWALLGRTLNRFRRQALGLPATGPTEALRHMRQREQPLLFGFSEAVVPRPSGWPARARLTGWWYPGAWSDWDVSPELRAFLDAGEPPVVVTLGNLAARDEPRLDGIVLEALRRTGRRAVVTLPWREPHHPLPAHVLRVGHVPYEWLLPRAAGIIYHGGAGTTGEALRAGLPAFVVPGFLDQSFWGYRLHQCGVAPPPVPARRLTVETVVEALDGMRPDSPRALAATALARRLRAEDGVGAAVDTLLRYTGGRREAA